MCILHVHVEYSNYLMIHTSYDLTATKQPPPPHPPPHPAVLSVFDSVCLSICLSRWLDKVISLNVLKACYRTSTVELSN